MTISVSKRRCQRCGKKRNLIERLFALDDEYCDECRFDTDQEHREKRELPVRKIPKRTARRSR